MSTALTAWIDALGHALLHATWQLGLLAGALWLVLRLCADRAATTRYALCAAALFTAPLVFVGTTLWFLDPSAVELAALEAVPETAARPAVPTSRSAVAVTGAMRDSSMVRTGAVALWSFGMLCFGVRFLIGLAQACSLRHSGHRPVSATLRARASALATSLGIAHPIAVVASTRVAVPMVVGILRPMILLPPSALTGLTPLQLEYIVLHELAHIRRRDLWVNFIQGLVEVTLFFHPAIWWMSNRLRAERELCCDDEVLAHGASGTTYARALLSLSEHRLQPALGAAATDGSLRFRIERLVGRPGRPQRGVRGLAAAALFCVLGTLSAQQSFADEDLGQMVDSLLEMQIVLPEDTSLSPAEEGARLRAQLDGLLDERRAILERMDTLLTEDPDRWGLLVTLRTAQVDEHVADTIAASDVPSGLTEQQATFYRTALEQRSAKLRSRALEHYARAAEMSGPLALVEEAREALSQRDEPELPTDGDLLPAALDALDTDRLLQAATSTGPDDAHVGTIWLTTAERLFEEGRSEEALVWYSAAIPVLPSTSRRFARYKSAWCHVNMGSFDTGISVMSTLIDDGEPLFRDEALDDLARFYVQAGREREGQRRFIRWGERARWKAAAP